MPDYKQMLGMKYKLNSSLLLPTALLSLGLGLKICGGGAAGLSAQESSGFHLPQDASLIIKLKNLEEGQAPFISHNLLFFTYKGDEQTKAVGLVFKSEGFAKLRMLERNSHDVFIYAIPIPIEKRVVYRYWVDGLWQRDPANANHYRDNYEVAVSLFENNDPSLVRSTNPIVLNGDYDFYAYFEPEEHVYILGSFNNWSPFISPLEEVEPGKYYIRIRHLQPGEYQYYFWVGGVKHLDSRNYRVVINNEGERVSIFTVTAGD
ncbi:glycogen-binding domain-containing protein [Candidatus Haliotispira prima]|uniref:Glycogen-binding domain-containing protein n=1 Tax=Candidatus Haliotispira prima TaxID=3034016 RepID=A0ABY8MIZ4_9SPIO|nr:glycogen-binding domain-containing protein [Candidatus Haliotispira prima]